MKRLVRTTLAVAACTVLGSSSAYAQASRTWVSGVGDDANPCSRTAPCKTFAGAISKTAAGGEISVLDPGGYGAVTITKSITINGTGENASVLVSGTNGIIIAAAGTDTVRLKHLQLQGMGTGLVGIKVNTAASVVIDDVMIYGYDTGIETNAGNTTVNDAVITLNRSFGVHSKGASSLTLENSLLTQNSVAAQASDTSALRLSNNGIYNNATGFGCGGGTLASAGNNRKANNVGGVVPVCAPNATVTIQ